MSIDAESISGKTGETCRRSGRYRMVEHPEVTKIIAKDDDFPSYRGEHVTWVWEEPGNCPDPDPE